MGTLVALSPMVFPSNLGDQLWTCIRPIPALHGIDMSDRCSTEFYQFILNGVEKLKTEDPRYVKHDTVFQAHADLTRLMNRLIETSLDEGRIEIESDVFDRLKGWFCPCYPFC